LEAGLALKTHGSLVKRLTPLRAGVASCFLSFKFKQLPNLKAQFFFNLETANPMYEVTTTLTSLLFKDVCFATIPKAAEAVMAPLAFIAFIAFIAGTVLETKSEKDTTSEKLAESSQHLIQHLWLTPACACMCQMLTGTMQNIRQ